MDNNLVELVKYKNRKLYMPKMGYVGLEDLIGMIQTGKNVVITDYKTKKDVTNEILKSAIFNNKQFSLTNADLFSIIQNGLNDVM